ncbi:MAG: energy transducer TonB [Candidatus Margulisbacteria bacterium]|jgi:TonB family protein|nr:energy transducer TonB [Candidatus Margulisiibacteriota bacterium]
MIRYFFISLLLHLLAVTAYAAACGFVLPGNFAHGSALPRAMVLPAVFYAPPADSGILEKNSAVFSEETLGVAELSAYAHPDNLAPRYPPLALLNRWQGETVLLLRIDRLGAVQGASLLASSGYKILDIAALDSAVNWRFPGLNKNVQVRFPVKFVLQNSAFPRR